MLILFYASIIFSIIFFGISLWKHSYLFLIFTVTCSIPYALYFAAYPTLRFSILIPFLFIGIFLMTKKYTKAA